MYSLISLVLISLGLSIAGLAGGYLIGRFTGTGRQAGDFKKQLDESQEELENYREQVYLQFGETAKKFERLQDSYADLHAQLANSADILCAGKAAGPLLAAPLVATGIASDDPHSDEQQETLAVETESQVVDAPKSDDVETTSDAPDTNLKHEQHESMDDTLAETEAAAMPVVDKTETHTTQMKPEAIEKLLDRQTDSTEPPLDKQLTFDKKDAA